MKLRIDLSSNIFQTCSAHLTFGINSANEYLLYSSEEKGSFFWEMRKRGRGETVENEGHATSTKKESKGG